MDQSKRKRKRRSRRSASGWKPGRLFLSLIMAASLVPAVTGYMHHRSLDTGGTATETAVAHGLSAAGQEKADDIPAAAGAQLNIGGEQPLPGQDTARKQTNSTEKGKSSELNGGVQDGAASAGRASDGSSAGGQSSTAPATAGSTKPTPPGQTAASGAGGGSEVGYAGGDAAGERISMYKNKLELAQTQCLRDAGAVLQDAAEQSSAARRGELDTAEAQTVSKKLAEQMSGAERACGSRFADLMKQAEKDEVPLASRQQWQTQYEEAKQQLRSKLTEQLKTIKSEGA